MSEEIKGILNKFDKVLENYELDKKFKQFSVDSICHLFPNEMLTIKNTITSLQQKVEQLENIRKEAIEFTNSHFKQMVADDEAQVLLNILNKGSDKK